MGMIFLVVGAALMSPVNEVVSEVTTATTTPTPIVDANGITTTLAPVQTYSGAVQSMAALIPLMMVIMIILFVFKAFAGSDEVHTARRERVKVRVASIIKNSKEFILRIESTSNKYKKYIQNLDELLGVTTVTISNPEKPLALIIDNFPDNNGKKNQLNISDQYDWYIADKHPDLYMFKVVGLHKKDSSKNVVYIIGKDDDNDAPYLIEIPIKYLETKFKVLRTTAWWNDNKELSEKV